MTAPLTISEISSRLNAHAESVCRDLLPGGRHVRGEWKCGSISGEAGDSLGVCLQGPKTGVWRDFADSASGGDLIDLCVAVKGLSVAQAVSWAKDWLGIKDDKPQFEPKRRKAFKRPERPQGMTAPTNPIREFFRKRGLTDATVKLFRVGAKGKNIVFPYFHDDVLKFIKFRPFDDKNAMFTSAESEPILFGWQAVDPMARFVVITEGELDAMSYRQAGIPALSIPRGAGKGNQEWIEYEYDRLLNFDAIYLSFDNDAPGQEGLQEVIPRIGRHRCMVPDLGPHKDANEALMAGFDLWQSIHRAKSLDPDELKTASEFHDATMAEFYAPPEAQGICLPWEKTWEKVRVREGEISIWNGINGHGKSLMLGQVVVGTVWQGQRWCIASMEMSPPRLLARMYRQSAATNQPTYEHGEKIRDYFLDMLWIFNIRGTTKGEKILEVFEYAYRRYGITQFLVDSLAKCGYNEDDYNGQKAFVDRLMEFAAEFNVHVHLVVHSRKGENEDTPPNKMDVKGSGAITDMVDNVFIVWRNKPKEDALASGDNQKIAKYGNEADCLLCCPKQRNGEWEGKFSLWFDKASLQYLESSNGRPVAYVAQ